MIIYRNPFEQWFWEGGWFYIGTVLLAIGVGCVLIWVGCILWDKYNVWRRR